MKARSNHTRINHRRMGAYLYYGSGIIGMIAFLYLIAIPGHSDYCLAAHVADDWSTMGYIIRGVIALTVLGICTKVGDYGAYLKGFYDENR